MDNNKNHPDRRLAMEEDGTGGELLEWCFKDLYLSVEITPEKVFEIMIRDEEGKFYHAKFKL